MNLVAMRFDTEYQDVTITKVVGSIEGGYQIERSDGWMFFVPKDAPVTPRIGSTARFFGRGVGYAVRGLLIDGEPVFYRTAAEDDDYHADEMYGATVDDLLAKWDAGHSIWTLELGGLGPGYEQCIQIMAVEFARAGKGMDRTPDDTGDYRAFGKLCDAALAKMELGPSGAQYGAAKWLAWQWCFRGGPRALIERARREKRDVIQASRHFPRAPVVAQQERSK